ncbi:MAG: helix-turn-helix transcriptional regulator [Tissierellia bacterium]|nr:helix-turn-helix transcriptional regulator [Tissierellia bacterium]
MKHQYSGGTLTETSLLILLSLLDTSHGYAIGQEVEVMTEGRVVLGPGTLYGALKIMEKKQWIKLHGTMGRTKQYEITKEGREMIRQEKERMMELIALIEERMVE